MQQSRGREGPRLEKLECGQQRSHPLNSVSTRTARVSLLCTWLRPARECFSFTPNVWPFSACCSEDRIISKLWSLTLTLRVKAACARAGLIAVAGVDVGERARLGSSALALGTPCAECSGLRGASVDVRTAARSTRPAARATTPAAMATLCAEPSAADIKGMLALIDSLRAQVSELQGLLEQRTHEADEVRVCNCCGGRMLMNAPH